MAVVYLHRKKSDNSIFYVGMGMYKSRANYFKGRNPHWTNVFNKYGANVDLIAEDITIDEAIELEMLVIETIGLDNLTNITLGGEGSLGLKHSKESIAKMRKIKANTKPSKECYIKGVETRKQNSINVKELVSGLEFKMAYSSDFTEVPKRLIYSNSKHDRPIRSGKYKGMNFITL